MNIFDVLNKLDARDEKPVYKFELDGLALNFWAVTPIAGLMIASALLNKPIALLGCELVDIRQLHTEPPVQLDTIGRMTTLDS